MTSKCGKNKKVARVAQQGLGQDDVHDASTIAEHENENITQDKLSSKISKKITLF